MTVPQTTSHRFSNMSLPSGGPLRQVPLRVLNMLLARSEREEVTPPSSPVKSYQTSLDTNSEFDPLANLNLKQNPAIRPLHPEAGQMVVREESTSIKSSRCEPDFITKRMQTIIANVAVGASPAIYNEWLRYMQEYSEGCFNLSNPPQPPPALFNKDMDFLIAPYPPDESQRNAAVMRLFPVANSRKPTGPMYDILINSIMICDVAGASASVFTKDREHFNIGVREPFEDRQHNEFVNCSREQSLPAHVLLGRNPMIIYDLAKDWRFCNHPIVQSGIRFFAGVPIICHTGEVVGVFYVYDRNPRTPQSFSVVHERELRSASETVMMLWSQPNQENTPPDSPTTQRPFSDSTLTAVDHNHPPRTPEADKDGNSDRQMYRNAPDSPTLGSNSPVTVRESWEAPEERLDSVLGFRHEDGSIRDAQALEVSTRRTFPDFPFFELKCLLESWARELCFDTCYVAELRPTSFYLSHEELIQNPGAMNTQIIASRGELPASELDIRFHLIALNVSGALVWESDGTRSCSEGLVMSLDPNQPDSFGDINTGLLFGAFRKTERKTPGGENVGNHVAPDFKEVIKVGNILKSILANRLMPMGTIAPCWSVNDMYYANQAAESLFEYPANEAIRVD